MPKGQGGLPMGFRPNGVLIAAVAALLVSIQCSVETSGIAPPHPTVAVSPAFICPGESVEVTWDVRSGQADSADCRPGGAGGAECISVDRSSTPAVSAWDATADLQIPGSRTISVDETTEFFARARVTSFMGSGRSSDVTDSDTATVITAGVEEDGPFGRVSFEFSGGCVGASPSWSQSTSRIGSPVACKWSRSATSAAT